LNWLIAGLTSVVTVEAMLRLPLRSSVRHLLKLLSRAGSVLRSSRISDHWKHRALLGYSSRVAWEAFVLGAMLGGLLLLIAGTTTLADYFLSPDSGTLDFMQSALGLVYCSTVAVVYLSMRRRRDPEQV
jgi:hypothetical protein